MMQLLCNGQTLDLYADAGIQFTHDNPLFAFDELKCERTTQFKLPSTPTNDRVFALARIPAYKGTGMRGKFAATLTMGVIIKEGYLYIASYDGTDYQAVFVTGELVGLQAVKNAGKLPEIARDYTRVYSTLEDGADKNAFDYDWQQIKYRQAQAVPSAPSVSVDWLVRRICTDFGISVTLPNIAKRLAIVPPYPRTLQESSVHFVNEGYNVLPVYEDTPTDYNNSLNTECILLRHRDIEWMTYVTEAGGIVRQTWEYLTQCLIAEQNLTLNFPIDFPTDLFLIKVTDPTANKMDGVQFLGDYSFFKYPSADESVDTDTGACVTTDDCVITGDPLRGRSVEIQKGDIILFVTPYDYIDGVAIQDPQLIKNGWAFHQRDWSSYIKMQGTSDKATTGETIRLRDNVPDIDFSMLLKCIAAIDGKVLNFEGGAIKFEDLNTTGYSVVVLDKLVARKDVERTFSDFAQRSVVTYRQDDITPALYIFKEAYEVDNDNIEAEKVLLELPFSPASEIYENGEIRAYINNEYEDSKEFAIMQLTGTGGDTYMHRVPLVRCAGLQALCDASTQFKISVRMTAYEYMRIGAKTLLMVDGIKYLWTERSWQKDEAQFTLAKVP